MELKKMQLSKRLQAVVDNVTVGNRVADIGCDHAYISIYLIEHKIATKVIAMDINKGPLKKAVENIKKYGYEKDIDIRLSDGAKKLEEGEADTILIAGMGGALMTKILSDSTKVVDGVQELVLQPQSEIFLVRKHFHKIGFQIIKENMVIDEGKYYVMMKAVKGIEHYQREVHYRYGKILLEQKHPILKEQLQKEYATTTKLLEQLSKNPSEHAASRMEELKEILQYIEEGMSYYDTKSI